MTKRSSFRYFKTSPEITRLAMMLSPPLVDHTRYICHASARLRVDANMLGLALGYAAVCLLSRLSFAEGATRAGCGVRLAVWGLQEDIIALLLGVMCCLELTLKAKLN